MAVDKLWYLQQMGIEPYVPRAVARTTQQTPSQASDLPATHRQGTVVPEPDAVVAQQPASDDDNAASQWQVLQQQVVGCRKCVLHESRTQTVFGIGDHQAQWMFIGEAPGMDEDRKGEPFVGRAGQLLNKMLKAIGFNRNEVYIANIIKCRPPDNRNPRLEEIVQCVDYLYRQIRLVQPQIIILLGGVAATSLLKQQTPVSRLRGLVHHIEASEAPIIVTYHPAYLLRSPDQKAAAWEDLKFACKTIGRDL
ncbi:MAG: uracil-DNA glycosylase [Chromatiales bacterium]|nr:uracil-DNA glycosylase [Chromatiales bacterium]